MSFDFDAAVVAPFRMQPGLRRMDAGAPHLSPMAAGLKAQREKLAVLSAFAEQALCAQPGFDARPALRSVAALAAAEHPTHWHWDGQRAQALGLGLAVDEGGGIEQRQAGVFGLGDELVRCLNPLPAHWRLAGLLALTFSEDLAVIDTERGTVPWLAVALPSHWAPEDKVGRHFMDIHAPVADNQAIVRAADALLDLVSGRRQADERWERFVWTVSAQPRLHAHPARVDREGWQPSTLAQLPAGAWWRTERQTFIPLPDLGQAVFTVRVDVTPLAQVIDNVERAQRLHDALASMSDAVLAYRGLTAARAPLLAWLSSLA